MMGPVTLVPRLEGVEVLVEYKLKKPRTHCFISTASKTMLLIDEVGSDNVGVLLDTGHAAAGSENPAESIALLNGRAKHYLSYLHFNDNYHTWDDDMLVGVCPPAGAGRDALLAEKNRVLRLADPGHIPLPRRRDPVRDRIDSMDRLYFKAN